LTVPPSTPNLLSTPKNVGRHLVRLEQLYASMDRSYKNTADRYGFECQGCEDNCCLTLFYHHTQVEYLYLANGFRSLERQLRFAIRERAEAVCTAVRVMCPLNVDDRCCLYAFRPMICRLHGVPSELHRPDGKTTRMPGCAAFTERCGQTDFIPLDRTPFYRVLATIEQAVRRDSSLAGKIKMTVAQMILAS
jgi:Fe-S-cluster containining protein